MGNEEIRTNYPMVQSIVHSVLSIQLNKSEFILRFLSTKS